MKARLGLRRMTVWCRLAAAVLLSLAVFGCGADKPCPSSFDTRAWLSAPVGTSKRRALADQVVACGFAANADKRTVRTLLGVAPHLEEQTRSEREREWHYAVGDTNGGLGPAQAQDLVILFDSSGRVKQAVVSPP
jgi:hypothetical protein